MKNIEVVTCQDDYLNTNEIIHDYTFYRQMICEGKKMDFEARNQIYHGL